MTPKIIYIKDLTVFGLDPKLLEIAKFVVNHFGLSTVTSAGRPGDKGVHGTWPIRGIDFRCHNTDLGRRVADSVNERWVYDPSRPEMQCALYHDAGSGIHLHLQAHYNTEARDAQ